MVRCCSTATTARRKVMVWQKCFIMMFIFIAIFSFFLFIPNYTFPFDMAPLWPWELFFKRHMVWNARVVMRMSQADSFLLRFIVMASRQNHGFSFILTRRMFWSSEIRNGCLWHTVSLFIWPRRTYHVLFTFPLFSRASRHSPWVSHKEVTSIR